MANYTCGDGKTYATIQAGIDAIPGNLLGHGREWVQAWPKAAGYAETLNINTGFSNASDNVDYVDVEAMVSHGGLRGGGIVLDISHNVDTNLIVLGPFTKFHGFCITGINSAVTSWSNAVIYLFNGIKFYDNIIYDFYAAGSIYLVNAAGGNALICNNQIINTTAASSVTIFGLTGTYTVGSQLYLFNNSVYGPTGRAIDGWNKNYENIINNALFHGTSFYAVTGGTNYIINYNVEIDASYTGGVGNLINKAAANQFVSVTAGSEILYPKRGSVLLRNGYNATAYAPRDCRGIARIYEDEPYYITGAIHVPPARVVANLTNRRGNLRPNCYHETI